jgi:cyclophilin family peptidyl-prolyl cis-trans isomerase
MQISVPIRLSAALVALTLPLLPTPSAMGAEEVAVRLELSQRFYYEGDPLNVRITVINPGDKKVENPIKSALFDGFYVRRDGEVIERTGETEAEEPSGIAKIAPGSFYGAVVNLVDLYPELGKIGTYEVYWSAHRIVSEMLVVTILPRFDPTKDYRGEIETDQGSIVVDLFGKQSPIAVKSFIDLANAGFYDDLQISEVRTDEYVVGGDPRFASEPRQPIQYPAEQSALPLVAGTVVMRPVRPTPPANGSTFVILLRPQPSWTGQVTVLGQVVEGLDVVQRLSRLPSSMRNSQPNFKPLREVKIQRVTIREKPNEAAGS